MKKLGYTPMFYANLEYLESDFDRSQLPYDLWYAQYASAAEVEDKGYSGSIPARAVLRGLREQWI